jgi:hypothetical protein
MQHVSISMNVDGINEFVVPTPSGKYCTRVCMSRTLFMNKNESICYLKKNFLSFSPTSMKTFVCVFAVFGFLFGLVSMSLDRINVHVK